MDAPHSSPAASAILLPVDLDPERYVHFRLQIEAPIARLEMKVVEDQNFRKNDDYVLKLNSYDLGVDVELADAINRIRFCHPEVRCLVITSAEDRIFCSGANIYMLGSSTHSFKVNFCKYTNETRLYLEDLAANSGVATIAAVNGTASGGGYELALACEQIVLVDDQSSAVSFPETPLLAVLPGTGGLTRLVDKRKVRRDRADVFSTLVEGIRGKRAIAWGLVDALLPRSRWAEGIAALAQEAARARPEKPGAGLRWTPLAREAHSSGYRYRYVDLTIDPKKRTAELLVRGPRGDEPMTGEAFERAGCEAWALRAFRELDEALLRLRFEYPTIGTICVRTAGDIEAVRRADRGLLAAQEHWLGREILLHQRRVLKRFENMARSLFALIDAGSCFAGSLFELALAADRSYMLNDPDTSVTIALSAANAGVLAGANGLSRLATRFLATPEQVARVLEAQEPIDAETADALGLVTFIPDEIDWDDEIRIAIEERVNYSPDALTGMENNLRFAGPETLETKIFGRLSAWQNWIFQRPNAVGPRGALSCYGKQVRPEFSLERT